MGETSSEKAAKPEPTWWRALVAIGITFITLGNASDATLLMKELGLEIYSYISNEFEYQTLASVHVGNTVDYIEDMLGKPQVSRSVGRDVSANYFFGGDYLLTVFYKDNRVEAYTWISLDDGFVPEIDMANGEQRQLGDFGFADMPLEATDYTIDDSRIVRFYVEALEGGRASGFLGTYLGNIQYGAFGPADAITGLYRAEVEGDSVAVDSARATLRKQGKPNLYGRGNLPVAMVEKSILSNSEFAGYFGVE